MKMTCIVIDDEPLQREGIAGYIRNIGFLEVRGICEDALYAAEIMGREHIDLLFLDIEMPKIQGLDFLRSLKNPPLAIVITAYSDYAVQGFELDVVDYLLKPVSFERFLKATNKAFEYFRSVQQKNDAHTSEYFFIKSNNKLEKILLDDILYIEALQNYVVVHCAKKKLVSYLTMKSIEERLSPQKFLRIHKSYIVAIEKIDALEGNQIYIGATPLPLSRDNRAAIMARIVDGRLFGRE